MKNLCYLLMILMVMSCGKEQEILDTDLIGTYLLNKVSGDCIGIPLSGQGDNVGCIAIPTLEVNCSMIEIQGNGILKYSFSLIEGTGTYTIDGSDLTLCLDRCLPFKFENNTLTLQTGTLPDCDLIYTYTRSLQSIQEIIAIYGEKSISKVKINGQLRESYTYNVDGKIQSTIFYNEEGNISNKYNYAYEPFKVILTRESFSPDFILRYEYYDESFDRSRRDKYSETGELIDYRLYFHTTDGCWVDRIENYKDDQLSTLSDYDYSGDNCDITINTFNDGNLFSSTTIVNDGMKYSNSATTIDLLKQKKLANDVSYTYTRNNELDQSRSFVSTFTYDELNYPATEVKTYLDGNIEIITYEYKN